MAALASIVILGFCFMGVAHPLSFNHSTLQSDEASDIQVLGDAKIGADSAQLTDTKTVFSVGRLNYMQPFPLWNGSSNWAASFNTSFRFQIKNTTVLAGDGMAFFVSEFPDIPVDSTGRGLGLFDNSTTDGNGIIAVEFDTFENPEYQDPNGNHIGIDVNSIISKITTKTNLSFQLKSASSVSGWVDYSSSLALLQVYAVDNSDVKPHTSLLSLNINLTNYLPENVYVGFSAATGSYFEDHTLYSWNFSSTDQPKGESSNVGLTKAESSKVGLTKAESSKVGLIAGLAAGGVFILVLILVVISIYVIRSREKRKAAQYWRQLNVITGLNLPHYYTYRELSVATKHFRMTELLGRGGFGSVFRGVLPSNGSEVAVKCCISQGSAQGEKEFLAEISIISRIRHRHLVQLKGWCHNKETLLLVYEYLPNRSLDQHLFDEKSIALDWNTRYRIVCGLGSALQYLHEECETVIIHRDIKASNVMLDSNFNAKLGDFGLARQLGDGVEGHTTVAAGTLGYMAPECVDTGRATTESDMHSFGVVLLEVACGRRPIDKTISEEHNGRLVDWVWFLYASGRLEEAADARLGGQFEALQLERVLVLGLACSHPDPTSRPTIHQAREALLNRTPLPTIPISKPVSHHSRPMELMFSSSSNNSAIAALAVPHLTLPLHQSLKRFVARKLQHKHSI